DYIIPIYYNIKETKVHIVKKNVEEKMAKYSFAGLNINNQNIKFNPNKTMDCEYYYISGTINIDLLVWAKKTFPTEITNTLDAVLMRCGLKEKIDLPYIPNETFFKKHDNLRCMFIFVNAI